MSVKKVLVTGGSGFIGTHVVNKLVEAGWQVTVPTRRRSRSMHLVLLPGVEVVEANLDNDVDLRKLMAGQHAVVEFFKRAAVMLEERAESAEMRGTLDQRDPMALLCETQRTGEAGDAATEDGD